MTLPFTAAAVRRAVASGRVAAVDVCQAALDRIAQADSASAASATVRANGPI